jgi:hypothetical protein
MKYYIVKIGKERGGTHRNECKQPFQFAEKNHFFTINSCLVVSNTIGQYFVMLNTRNSI